MMICAGKLRWTAILVMLLGWPSASATGDEQKPVGGSEPATQPDAQHVAHVLELAHNAKSLQVGIARPAQAELNKLVDGGDGTLFELLADPDPKLSLVAFDVLHTLPSKRSSPEAVRAERRAVPKLLEAIHQPGGKGRSFWPLSCLAECGGPGYVGLFSLLAEDDWETHVQALRRLSAMKPPSDEEDLRQVWEQIPALLQDVNEDRTSGIAESVLKTFPVNDRMADALRRGLPGVPCQRLMWFLAGMQPRTEAIDGAYLAAFSRLGDDHTFTVSSGGDVDYRRAMRSPIEEVRRGALMYAAGLTFERPADQELASLALEVPLDKDGRAAAAAGRIVCRTRPPRF